MTVSAAHLTCWIWWTEAVESGKSLAPSVVIFALLSIAAFVVANNPMGLMLIWSATAVVYLTFSPFIAFIYCSVPVSLTLLVHLVGGSSFSRIVMEGTVALLLVTIGFHLCVSARNTSAASVERARLMKSYASLMLNFPQHCSSQGMPRSQKNAAVSQQACIIAWDIG